MRADADQQHAVRGLQGERRADRLPSGDGPDKGVGGELSGPTEVGTGVVKDDKAPLSEIIEILNDRFDQVLAQEIADDLRAALEQIEDVFSDLEARTAAA